jgi:TPP-dependent pyruvate/acetoin dehydrogenase alpha subunit
MGSARVDGNDVFAVFAAAREALERLRRGEGPSFLECMTYRWREHVGPLWDYDKGYRTKAEVDEWIARCPIKRATERLVAEGLWSMEEVERVGRDCRDEVNRAVADAKAAPFPAVQDLTVGTY